MFPFLSWFWGQFRSRETAIGEARSLQSTTSMIPDKQVSTGFNGMHNCRIRKTWFDFQRYLFWLGASFFTCLRSRHSPGIKQDNVCQYVKHGTKPTVSNGTVNILSHKQQLLLLLSWLYQVPVSQRCPNQQLISYEVWTQTGTRLLWLGFIFLQECLFRAHTRHSNGYASRKKKGMCFPFLINFRWWTWEKSISLESVCLC